MEENLNGGFINDINEPKRTQLLTVTCILTWICCGFMIVTSLIGLVTNSAEKQAEQIEQIRTMNPEMADNMEAALAGQNGSMQIINQLVSIICLGLSAFGAWWMWNLKKKGFFIYLAGEIIPYLSLLFAGKAAMAALGSLGSMGPAILGIAVVLMLVCDAAFIIMYAVNLKHMKS